MPLLIWILLLAGSAAIAQQPRKNLLFIVTDDQRFDQLGCAGHPVLQTTTMDSLALRGVRFTNAFVTTAICAASRASIMTSRREGSHGYTFGKPPMPKELADDTYFARLKRAGYATGFVGKWGVRFAKDALGDAIDYRPASGHPYLKKGRPHLTTIVADQAIAFVAQQTKQKPFCLTVSFHAPHAEDGHKDQYIPPPELAQLYVDAVVPEPPYAQSGFAVLPEFLQKSMGRKRWAWRFDQRDKQVRRTKDYWRMITGVDQAMARIVSSLEAHGFADNTIIVFTSDNGYFLGERGLAGKWLIYEESIRIPLIVFDPSQPKERQGVTNDEMVLNLDFAPTLLDLAGVAIPEGYQGKSLVPLLAGESPPWRSDFLYEHRMNHEDIPKSQGVRGARWVYARFDEQDPVYEQLFDLLQDPQQLHNLSQAPKHADVLAQQRSRCDELLRGR
jgi:arylsulfatase A-like enzyme